MGQPQRSNKAPLAIALAVIAGFVVMVMIGLVVLGGVWFLRASTYESQIQRQRSMAEDQRELVEQLQQATRNESQIMEDFDQLQRAHRQSIDEWRAKMEIGNKLKAERSPIIDEVEIVEVLDDGRVKIRWLSGQPGEEVVSLDRLRREEQ